MKKIMSLMLGLSLLSGMAVFAQENNKSTTKATRKRGTKSTTSKGTKKKATTAPHGN